MLAYKFLCRFLLDELHEQSIKNGSCRICEFSMQFTENFHVFLKECIMDVTL